MVKFKIGIRFDHRANPLVGIIVRSDDYFYIDHRSAHDLSDIADKFGTESAEWFDMLTDLSRLIESGASLTAFSGSYMESPWQSLDSASVGNAVTEYFGISSGDLRVSLEGGRKSANYIIAAGRSAFSGTIASPEVGLAVVQLQQMQSVLDGAAAGKPSNGDANSVHVSRSKDDPVPSMPDAIDRALWALEASKGYTGTSRQDLIAAALSSLLGYADWANQPGSNSATVLSR